MANRNPSVGDLHAFGWAMAGGFGVLGILLWVFGPEPNQLAWTGAKVQGVAIALWGLGGVLFGVSRGPAGLARKVYVAWMTGAMCLGTGMTFLLLSVLFVVLLPVFSLIRLKDPLRLRLAPPGASYWEDHVHHESTSERTLRPF